MSAEKHGSSFDVMVQMQDFRLNIYRETNKLTPWSTVLLEKLTDSPLVKKFSTEAEGSSRLGCMY